VVKETAPELLRAELSSPKWKPQVIAMSGVTIATSPSNANCKLPDAVSKSWLNPQPVNVVTKNNLIVRDADVLSNWPDSKPSQFGFQ